LLEYAVSLADPNSQIQVRRNPNKTLKLYNSSENMLGEKLRFMVFLPISKFYVLTSGRWNNGIGEF